MRIEDGVKRNLKFLKDDIHRVSMHVEHLTIQLMPEVMEPKLPAVFSSRGPFQN